MQIRWESAGRTTGRNTTRFTRIEHPREDKLVTLLQRIPGEAPLSKTNYDGRAQVVRTSTTGRNTTRSTYLTCIRSIAKRRQCTNWTELVKVRQGVLLWRKIRLKKDLGKTALVVGPSHWYGGETIETWKHPEKSAAFAARNKS